MSDFQIYHNTSENSKNYPYLLDVQSPLLSNLKTRLVIPLVKISIGMVPIKILNPKVMVSEIEYLVLTQQMASIPSNQLGQNINNIQINRTEVLSAIDFLITGF